MTHSKPTWPRILMFIVLGILLLIIILLLSATSIAEIALNQKADDQLGRRIHVGDIDLNYFNGKAGVEDLVIYEENSVDTFLYIGSARINLDPWQLLDNHLYITDIEVTEPYVRVIMGDEGLNFDDLAETNSQDNAPIDSLQYPEAASEFHFTIERIRLRNGRVSFSDNTIPEPFHYEVSQIQLAVDGLRDDASDVPVDLSLNLNDEGLLTGLLLLDMIDPSNITLDGRIDSLALSTFSPYTLQYLAYPIDGGALSYDLHLQMNSEELVNENKILVSGFEFGDKIESEDAVTLPLKLALYILKDREDNITLDIPVNGDPNDPGFELDALIWKTFSNFIIKTAAQPFTSLAGLIEKDPDSLDRIPFDNLQDTLTVRQTDILDDLAAISKKKPDLAFRITQFMNEAKELRQLAVREAIHRFQPEDPGSVDSEDKDFRSWLLLQTGGSDGDIAEDLCIRMIGRDSLSAKLDQIIEDRNQAISTYLRNEKGVPGQAFSLDTNPDPERSADLTVPEFRVSVNVK